jgi:hypothetical protein
MFRKGMDSSDYRAVPVKTDLHITVKTQLNIKSHRFQIKQDKPAEIAGCMNNPWDDTTDRKNRILNTRNGTRLSDAFKDIFLPKIDIKVKLN